MKTIKIILENTLKFIFKIRSQKIIFYQKVIKYVLSQLHSLLY